MSFADRLLDDSNVVLEQPGQAAPEPHFAGVLFTQLDLYKASRADQAAGILNWLKSNTPSASLTRSLRRTGFADVLDLAAAS